MSRQMRSSDARGKAPAIVPSLANSSSSDDDIVSASLQVVRPFQRRFDRGGDDLTPYEGVHIAYRTRSQCSVQTTSASSQFCTGSGGSSL